MTLQVGKLESLLAKIRRNAARPRAQRVPGAPPPVIDASPVMADEIVEEPPQVVLPPAAATNEARAISGVVSVPQLTETEELLDDDIVEVEAAVEAEVPAATGSLDDIEIDFDDEEKPPASSSRTRVATTMDEALVAAAEQLEMQEGREVPLKTPPPESGPQAAVPLPPGIQAPRAPDVADLLEQEVPMQAGVSAASPTAEQLGQTIDLDEARGPSLELDVRQAEAAQASSAPSEELEIALPQREFGGGYHDQLMPPPEARQELEAHRQRVGDELIAAPPESLAQAPSLSSFSVSQTTVTTDSPSGAVSMVTVDAPGTPEIIARPELSAVPAAKYLQGPSRRPDTFLELLDSSLGLIKNEG
jgi:hypothetical protein